RGKAPLELRAGALGAAAQHQRRARRSQAGTGRGPGRRTRGRERAGFRHRAPVKRALVVAALCACSHAPVRGPDLDPVDLAARIAKAHAVPESLSGEGKAFVDATRNGGRYPFQVAVRRPASLRIAALDPLGNPAALLVADEQGRFALLDTRSNVYYRGPATAENLARLIPAPLRPAELVAFLL